MPASSPESDRAACRAMMRGGSRSFSMAARLLPRRVHEPATALYAFCRLADDLVDDGGGQAALPMLHERLDLAYGGSPADHPVDRAFAETVHRHAIPQALPQALLDGFAWDLQGRRYNTLDELMDYAARVAGSVGAMMTVLMGVQCTQALARACDLGVAMQLTNIARDVGEDARAGRLYLPLDWLREAGVQPDAFLAAPTFDQALAGVIGRLLKAADALYISGCSGIAALPLTCRPGIRAAAALYAGIGRELARSGCNSVAWRAHVPASRKAAMLGRALLPRLSSAPYAHAAVLPACQYLVDAVADAMVPAQVVAVQNRVDWVFDLFERLQERQLEMS